MNSFRLVSVLSCLGQGAVVASHLLVMTAMGARRDRMLLVQRRPDRKFTDVAEHGLTCESLWRQGHQENIIEKRERRRHFDYERWLPDIFSGTDDL